MDGVVLIYRSVSREQCLHDRGWSEYLSELELHLQVSKHCSENAAGYALLRVYLNVNYGTELV